MNASPAAAAEGGKAATDRPTEYNVAHYILIWLTLMRRSSSVVGHARGRPTHRLTMHVARTQGSDSLPPPLPVSRQPPLAVAVQYDHVPDSRAGFAAVVASWPLIAQIKKQPAPWRAWPAIVIRVA